MSEGLTLQLILDAAESLRNRPAVEEPPDGWTYWAIDEAGIPRMYVYSRGCNP